MSFNLNGSPSHFIILSSIFKNYNTLDKIIKFTKLEKEKVIIIMEELIEEKMMLALQWYSQDDQEHTQSFVKGNREWLPLMIMSGIMDMIFFTSLMSL